MLENQVNNQIGRRCWCNNACRSGYYVVSGISWADLAEIFRRSCPAFSSLTNRGPVAPQTTQTGAMTRPAICAAGSTSWLTCGVFARQELMPISCLRPFAPPKTEPRERWRSTGALRGRHLGSPWRTAATSCCGPGRPTAARDPMWPLWHNLQLHFGVDVHQGYRDLTHSHVFVASSSSAHLAGAGFAANGLLNKLFWGRRVEAIASKSFAVFNSWDM